METILVSTENANELKMVKAFLKKNKLKSRVLSNEDKEDLVLGKLMEETDYNDLIPTEKFLQKLRD